jgi:cytochrome c-type biogenesis protein CcmF
MVALAVVLPLGAVLPWKRARLGTAARPLGPALALAVAFGGLAFAMQTGHSALGPVGAALAVWLVAGALTDLWLRAGRGDLAGKLQRLSRLPRADWGKLFAHSGLGITIFGVAAMTAWSVEDIRVASVGETFEVAGYQIALNDVSRSEGPNYITTMADMSVFRGKREVARLYPEKRVYPVAQMPTTEAAIANGVLRDIYLVIGDPQDGGGWAVRTYVKPFANWIWAGAIIMALGGVLSLTDRRYRVAAGARRAARAVAAE